MVVTKLESIR